MKKLILIITLILAFMLSACSPVSPAPVPPATPEATATEAPTPEPTEKPTPSPMLDPMQEKFAMAPEIDGLYKDIQEKDGIEKVVYLYDADNPYEGKEDEYAGEFKKEVEAKNYETEKMEELGGVVLESKVVFFYINEALEVGDPGIAPIGLDISSMNSQDKVKIFLDENFVVDSRMSSGIDLGSMRIQFDGEPLPLVSVDNKEATYVLSNYNLDIEFFIENQKAYDFKWGDDNPYFYNEDRTATLESWLGGLGIYGDFEIGEKGVINFDMERTYNFGDRMVEISSPVYFGLVNRAIGTFLVDGLMRFPQHDFTGCLVFLIGN